MKHAFSLVELSIVLVILGLLTGGILAGQSLIRASELRSVSTQYQQYITAAHSFRGKYFQIPGDITNAISFWGTAAACPGDGTVQTYAVVTCNGDGDGILEWTFGTTTSNEEFRFWQHLVNAGLIEGQYTGMPLNNNGYRRSMSLGNNIPRSRMSNGGFAMMGYADQPADSASLFAHGRYNGMVFGAPSVGDVDVFADLLRPEEGWNIDTKMDDGLPGKGNVTTPTSGNANGGTNCATTSVSSTALYELTTAAATCSLIFRTGL